MAKKGKKNKKQAELPGIKGPGVEPVVIEALDKAIDTYIPARDTRVTASTEEKKQKASLLEVLKANAGKLGRDSKTGVLSYTCNRDGEDLVLTLTPTEEKLRVRKAKDKKAPEDEHPDSE